MHRETIIESGNKVNPDKALILLHGRGASAEDILSLAPHLEVGDYLLVAPQATNHTWYPYSFLVPPAQNEPWLTGALELVGKTVASLEKRGISNERIYFMGFSQGACLTLEFTTRNAAQWGGIVAFTGGLIGDKIYKENYKGDFGGTPVYIGTSDPDPHVPVERVQESVTIMKGMNADVTVDVFKNMGHTITKDEINKANTIVFKSERK